MERSLPWGLPICLEQCFAAVEDLTRVKSSQKIGRFGVWNGPAGAFMNVASGQKRTRFAAGGTTAAAWSAGISAGTGGAGAGSAHPYGFDGIVEDDAGDDDMEVDRGLSPAPALGAVQWRCLRSAAEMLVRRVPIFRWDPNSLSIGIVGDLADKIALWEQERLDAQE